MITAVLDTNILVSGFFGEDKPHSIPGELIRRWRAGSFLLVLSEHILSELVETFNDPYFVTRLSETAIAEALESVLLDAIFQQITVAVAGIASHPEDDRVLATALSAQCHYIVTGDKRLLELATIEGVLLVSPRQFLGVLESESLA